MPTNRENARPNEWESEEEQENTLVLFAITAVCFLVLAGMVGISYYSGHLSSPLPATKIEKNETDTQIVNLMNEIKIVSDSEVDCPDDNSDLDIEESIRKLERTFPPNRATAATNSQRPVNPLLKPVASGSNNSGKASNAVITTEIGSPINPKPTGQNPQKADKPAANSSNIASTAADTKQPQGLRLMLGPKFKIYPEARKSAFNAVEPNATQLNGPDSAAQPKRKAKTETDGDSVKHTTQNPPNKTSNRNKKRNRL